MPAQCCSYHRKSLLIHSQRRRVARDRAGFAFFIFSGVLSNKRQALLRVVPTNVELSSTGTLLLLLLQVTLHTGVRRALYVFL